MIVVALQSGTSADGIDVAVVECSALETSADAGRPAVGLRVRHAATLDWDAALRERILAVSAGEPLTAGGFCELDTSLGRAFAEAASAGVEASGATPELVVSHGQTLFHWVDDGHARGTLQLGEPAWIAERVGAPVLSHVRASDIAAGGEGAPLMALFDRLWLGPDAAAAGRPLGSVNLGGIANVQLVRPDGEVVAFDSGPGNGLIDAVVVRASGGAAGYDDEGRLAAAGRVHEPLLDALLQHPYLAASPPKSTGRETFDLGVVDRAVVASGAEALPLEHLVATLTELTARTVVEAIPAADAPDVLIASGGGALNPVLLARLTAVAARRGIAVESSAARGIHPAVKESLMFAFLGFLSWHGVPARLSSGGTGEPRIAGRFTSGGTGEPRIAGRFTSGRMPLRLPPPLAGVASVTITSTDPGGPLR